MDFKKEIKLNLKSYIRLFGLIIFLVFPLFAAASIPSPDAIAVRVLPNAKHYSVLTWYQKNDFKGSPQNLTVDGYDAVRDGRTVYVNAANLDDNGNFFTNIYIISYNQQAENQTMDIFGQMLSHWKFNAGLNTAQISKQALINDTRRLADLAYMNELLERYKLKHGGSYPDLKSGSYVAGASTSKWPSWQGELGKALGATLPLDPLNSLGDCTGYDQEKATCWNTQTKSFKYAFNANQGDDSSISKTNVYWYKDGIFHVNLEQDNLLCGDGVLDADRGEECDGNVGVPEHYTCTTSCTEEYVPYCGDNLVNQASEECDGANSLIGWGCFKSTLSCDSCQTKCSDGSAPYSGQCGNGIKEGPEVCDIQDGVPGNGVAACLADCGGWYCTDSNLYHKEGGTCVNNCNTCTDPAKNISLGKTCKYSESSSPSPCNPSACADGYYLKLLGTNSTTGNSYGCSQCKLSDFPGATAVAVKTGCQTSVCSGQICQATACDTADGYNFYNGSCVKCPNHYSWSGNSCVADTQPANCGAKPSTAVWVGSSQFNQTWSGTSWQPATYPAAYDPSGQATCAFACPASLPNYDAVNKICKASCQPNCSGKSCGPDGCGGLCGTCVSNNTCQNGSCCSKTASLQACADNHHLTYFNNILTSSGDWWGTYQTADVTINSGKNVIAVMGKDDSGGYGISVKLTNGSCFSATTAEINQWKCQAAPVPLNWSDINFDDSSWPSAIPSTPAGPTGGNSLDAPMIWAAGAGEYATVYCRYSFTAD